MRKIVVYLVVLALAGGGVYYWQSNNDLLSMVSRYVENGDIQTLEARYSVQQIMDANQKKLLGDNSRQYLEPGYKYQPYVLMEVKFTQDKKTREGVALWSLVDGEMVLNTDTWEKTHGFEDAINAKATREEFKVINAIAKGNGTLSKDDLLSYLQLDADIVNPWLESVIEKHLVIKKGNQLALHFENPKILVAPQTKFNQMLVSKAYNHSQRISEKYSLSQIEKVAKAAFGSDFNIRRMSEVYLPIYHINVENPDGSTTVTQWNAVTGQMMTPNYHK
jgi:hypothetical protein